MRSLLMSMLSSDRKCSGKSLLLWAIIPLVAWYVSQHWYQLMLIQGNSMEPAYHHLQIVLLDKHSDRYVPGDVVAFFSETLDCILVKRIAAGPGDTAVVRDGSLLVNEDVSSVYPHTGSVLNPGALAEEIKLESRQYLVLGDNLEESIDSRYPQVGLVSEENILGKVCIPK